MLSSLVSISMPFSDFSENIYYCVNHSSDDDNWICGHDVCPLLLIQLSLEPTKISTYQFFLKPNNIIEVLRENTLYYMLLTPPSTKPPANPLRCNAIRCLSKWNFAISAMIFSLPTLFFCALSWWNPIRSVKASPDEASKFCFDHQVYNIG